MKKIMITLFSICCVLCMALSVQAAIVDSGKCGDDVSWVLEDNGTLTISGTGEMYNTGDYSLLGYHKYEDSIKKVIIKSGVTSIGKNAFRYLGNMESIEIQPGVKTVGAFAFDYCFSLTSIEFPEGVTTLGEPEQVNLFSEDYQLTKIVLPKSIKKMVDVVWSPPTADYPYGLNAHPTDAELESFRKNKPTLHIYYAGTQKDFDNITTWYWDGTENRPKDKLMRENDPLNTSLEGLYDEPRNVMTLVHCSDGIYCDCKGVSLDKSEITMNVGETIALRYTVYPARCGQNRPWSFSNASVAGIVGPYDTDNSAMYTDAASLTKLVYIKAKAVGETNITVTAFVYGGKKTASCKVKVVEPKKTTAASTKAESIIKKTPASVKTKVQKNKVTVSWKKLNKTDKNYSKVKNIQVQYSTDSKFKKNCVTKKVAKSKTKLVLKLKKKKTYFIRVRYVGKNGVSKWTKAKRVKTK